MTKELEASGDIGRCGGTGMVAYWDGSNYAGEMCRGCIDCERHDAECETELTSHGYTPCRCDERRAAMSRNDDPATTELLESLDELYPLPDDARRAERAGRTAAVLKRWMATAYADLSASVPAMIEAYRTANKGGTIMLPACNECGRRWACAHRKAEGQ